MRAYRRELNASTSGQPQELTAKRALDSGGVHAMLSRMSVEVPSKTTQSSKLSLHDWQAYHSLCQCSRN